MKVIKSIVCAAVLGSVSLVQADQAKCRVHGDSKKVESTSFRDVKYDPNNKTMSFVCHNNGRRYEYLNVSKERFAAFAKAKNKAQYFDDHFRDRYEFRRVTNYSGPCPYLRSRNR